MIEYDACIIGAGPGGLSAAVKLKNYKVCLIEREENVGGILKQCIHDGFGLLKFKEQLTGPEYIQKYIDKVEQSKIEIYKKTFVSEIKYLDEKNIIIELINPKQGMFQIKTKSIIFATGCRERTSKQVFIHGERPSGILPAGCAQYFVNILGYLPCKKCVILGSGDIGLIMARRLTLEGAKVLGVYEIKDIPSGLNRNIVQCLKDYDIPLYLSHTVIETHGDERLKGVTIAKVDENMKVIQATKKYIECDGLILSVGLIPENEITKQLDILIDYHTKGPLVDQNMMTNIKGIFACGNQVHVNDLVDYVSLSGEITAKSVLEYISKKAYKIKYVDINFSDDDFIYVVPKRVNIESQLKKLTIYLRSMKKIRNAIIKITINDKKIYKKKYIMLNPPEMEVININIDKLNETDKIEIQIVKG